MLEGLIPAWIGPAVILFVLTFLVLIIMPQAWREENSFWFAPIKFWFGIFPFMAGEKTCEWPRRFCGCGQ